ncbi:MAG: hypothetical protein GXN99_01000 [Candidatus Nanohaloarchaeota archaeon]|nr:hypothetical protein [Candidatus Nanohaloarchaeota archaeon]
MMLSPPSFILLKSSQPRKLSLVVVADKEEKAKAIQNYEKYTYLKALNNLEEFIKFRKQVLGHYSASLLPKKLELLQILAVSKRKPLNLEIDYKPYSQPQEHKDVIPLTFTSSLLLDLNISSNIKLDKHLSKAYYDDDWKASDALFYLYQKNKDVYVLDDVLTTGSVGLKSNRKPIPTKHAITAVDDIIAKSLYKEIKHYSPNKEIMLFIHQSYHNLFYILALPGLWSFELNETFSTSTQTWKDYEILQPRKEYASNTTGGYYAVRLPLLEFAVKTKLQYSFIVFRIITPKYYKSAGVWMLREAIRDALSKNPLKFNSTKEALKYISYHSAGKLDKAISRSTLLKLQTSQKKLF